MLAEPASQETYCVIITMTVEMARTRSTAVSHGLLLTRFIYTTKAARIT